MSDEESFVILGSSPLPSLEVDGVASSNQSEITTSSFLQSNTPDSRFSSLKNSQLNDLQNAQENADQEIVVVQGDITNIEPRKMIKTALETYTMENLIKGQQESMIKSIVQPEMSDLSPSMSYIKSTVEPQMAEAQSSVYNKQSKEEKLWSRQIPIQIEDKMISLRLEDCALKSPLEKQQKTGDSDSQTMKNSTNLKSSEEDRKSSSSASETKNTPPASEKSSLAASFIMGDVSADVLKTSVYSQFPSISMEACAEDVLKLQNMVVEYTQLKATIKKANNTMKLFYNNSLQWKDKLKTLEEDYKQQLESCKQEILLLRTQNEHIETNFKAQVGALEIARQKDREDTIQEISEKNALIENMRAQIIKLEEQQLASFEFVLKNQDDQQISQFENFYVKRKEHDNEIKSLERKLSELLAQNLDFKDVKEQYIDELNCLKVNLTSAEELIKKNRNEISELLAAGAENQKQIEVLEKSLKDLQTANEKQVERIALLEQQNEVYRKDFAMEQECRETVIKEKQQILQDLRLLQRKNQQLIAEHQRMSQSYEKKLRSEASMESVQFAAAAVDALSYVNNPQRPIRVLPSSSSVAPFSAPPASIYLCPVCNKAFKSLNILQSHVNDCIDRN